MDKLSNCYKRGSGCDQNHTKAFEWFEKSAKLGHSVAMYNVGDCYENGTGVTKDLNKAIEWYTKAMENGGYQWLQTYLDELIVAQHEENNDDDDEPLV